MRTLIMRAAPLFENKRAAHVSDLLLSTCPRQDSNLRHRL